MQDCAFHALRVVEVVRRRFGVLLALFVLVGIAQPGVAQEWRTVAPMPSPRYGMAAVELGGEIYVMGGRNRYGGHLSSVLRYNPESDTWQGGIAPLPLALEEPAAVVLDGKIYVIGGAIDGDEPVDDVFVYDAAEDAWQEVGSLDVKRFGHRAISVGGNIWVVGGRDDEGRLVGEVEVYNTIEDEWTVFDDWELQNPRVSFALVAIADVVYAMFGYGSSGPIPDAERFGPLTEADVFVLSFLLRGRLATVSVDNTAYFLGGRAEPDHVIDDVLLFTPSEQDVALRWREGPSMYTPRESFAAVTVGSDIYAIGGRTQDGARDGVVLSSVEVLSVSTGIETEGVAQHLSFRLEQNHPNPFTNSTTIPFAVEGHRPESVTLEVYDVQGRLVDTILNRVVAPGEYDVEWSGPINAPFSSGVYYYVLRRGQNRQTKMMTLIR